MSEKGEAKRDGARLTKNSGRGDYQKGDALLDIFTIDYKEYEKSFSISRDVWGKVCTDAFRNNQSEPLLKVILGAGNAKSRLGIVSWDIIEDYIRLRKLEEENAL
jgi:hypothetical protein